MKKKKNNKKDSTKTNLKIIIISYAIFAISVFLLTHLKMSCVINYKFSLLPFYWIVGIILFISVIVLCCKMNKGYAIKYAFSIIGVNLFGIVFLIMWGAIIDHSVSLIEFSKNASPTTAEIYRDVEKNITKHTKNNCVGVEIGNRCIVGNYESYSEDEDYYKLEYIYHLRYTVRDRVYTSTYTEKVSTEFSSELGASKSEQAKYSKGDYITIYYDNDNPSDFRLDYSEGYGKGAYIIELIILSIQVFCFIKHRKYWKKLKIENVLVNS